MSDKQSYIWNLPDDGAAHAARLVASGCEHVRIKAGGDDGRVWPQWADPVHTRPYLDAGLKVSPWFYVWPTSADRDAIVRAHQAHPFEEFALNPETEWRWQNSSANPWTNMTAALDGAQRWLAALRAKFPTARIAYSSCPSWADFPYEAFAGACDQAEPQHYWPRTLLRGENQVEAHYRRAGDAQPCVPILTASREYDDAGVVALAEEALASAPGDLAGFSAWEAGNAQYQWGAIAVCYTMLPWEDMTAQTHPDAPGQAESVLTHIDPTTGATILTINFGGVARSIEGYVVQDAGVSVIGQDGATYDRSVTPAGFGEWRKR